MHDNHVLELLYVVVLEVQLDHPFGGVTDDKPAWKLKVFILKGANKILCRDAVSAHSLQIEVDPDGSVPPTGDANFGNSVDVFQAFFDHRAGILVELLQRSVAIDGHPHDRCCTEFHLCHYRLIRILGQILQDLIDFGLHLVKRRVGIARKCEREVGYRDPWVGTGLEMADTWHAVHGRLDDVGDARVYDVRVGPGQCCRDGDSREIDVRKPVDTQAFIAQQSEQHEQGTQHPREYMAFDRDSRQTHGLTTSTRAPSVRNAAPSCTTTSPDWRPSTTSTIPS